MTDFNRMHFVEVITTEQKLPVILFFNRHRRTFFLALNTAGALQVRFQITRSGSLPEVNHLKHAMTKLNPEGRVIGLRWAAAQWRDISFPWKRVSPPYWQIAELIPSFFLILFLIIRLWKSWSPFSQILNCIHNTTPGLKKSMAALSSGTCGSRALCFEFSLSNL